jgi:hypothetical protein
MRITNPATKHEVRLLLRPICFGILATLTLTQGCATTGGKSPTLPPLQWVRLEYHFGLASVERPADATTRYGTQTVSSVDSSGVSRWFFEDRLVRVMFAPTARELAFSLTNKSDYSIRLVWDQAAFVNFDQTSNPVMHAGVRYSACRESKPSSVIVKGGILNDLIIGCDRIREPSIGSSWIVEPLIEDASFLAKDSASAIRFTQEKWAGKQFKVLLPIQIQDVVNDYIFTFALVSVSARSCERMEYLNMCL